MLKKVGVTIRRQRLSPPCSAGQPATAVALALFLLVAGCTGASQESPPPEPQAARPTEPASPAAQTAAPATSSADETQISRQQLKKILARGPQRFIQLVRVRPTFIKGKFFGWRILDYKGPGPLWPGDIVRSVNGKSIEKPDQFMAVWNELESRDELSVELVREGIQLTLHYRIVGQPTEVP